MDGTYTPHLPIDPPQPVLVDLTGYGPRRVRWGQDTAQWIRAAGFRPDRGLPAVADAVIVSMYGDWWVRCWVNLVNARGQVVTAAGLLLPASAVRPARSP